MCLEIYPILADQRELTLWRKPGFLNFARPCKIGLNNNDSGMCLEILSNSNSKLEL